MKFRTLATVLLTATIGFAQAGKTLDNAKVDKSEMKDGKVRVSIIAGQSQGVYIGDKGYFVKDGTKVENSDFEIDRMDDSRAFATTVFKSVDDMHAQTSLSTRIAKSKTCPRGGARPDLFDNEDIREGRQPAQGFAFANVVSAEKVHKSEIRVVIDKGFDDGVMPSSSAYASPASGRALSGYAGVEWVEAKKTSLTITAIVADDVLPKVKRIGYEKITCK